MSEQYDLILQEVAKQIITQFMNEQQTTLIFNITKTRNHHLTPSRQNLSSYFKNKSVPRSKHTPSLL